MNNRKVTGAVVVSAIVLIGFYTLILNNTNCLNSKQELATTTTESAPINSNSSLEVADSAQSPQASSEQELPTSERFDTKYNDGSFTIESDFLTPAGVEGFEVTLKLQNDQIASVSTAFDATHPHSEAINDKLFVPGISGVVEGKEVDDATLLSAVNGASLHSIAFNQALEGIKQEALRSSHNLTYSEN